ncbi:Biogenesis of lysosome-related organelles complex 1 subunit 2 [Bienertia sinuspersici]
MLGREGWQSATVRFLWRSSAPVRNSGGLTTDATKRRRRSGISSVSALAQDKPVLGKCSFHAFTKHTAAPLAASLLQSPRLHHQRQMTIVQFRNNSRMKLVKGYPGAKRASL